MHRSQLVVALLSVLLVAGAGTGGVLAATGPLQPQQSPNNTTAGTTTPASPNGTPAPSVTFDAQNSSGESVFVQSATLPQAGFIAINDSTRSANGTNQVIGASYLLNAGTTENIRIQLDEPLSDSKSLTAVVHLDSNDNQQFDFVASNGQQDPPLTRNDGRIVDIAEVTVRGTDAGGQSPAGETTDATTQSATDDTGPNGETTTDGDGGSGAFGPGFGPVVVVVALLAVALLAVRRY